jgi:hypothetical protein
MAQQPPVDQDLLNIKASRSQSETRHTRQDSSGRAIGPKHRPLPDNTQHSQQTDIHAPERIRTQQRTVADPHHRLRGHLYRRCQTSARKIFKILLYKKKTAAYWQNIELINQFFVVAGISQTEAKRIFVCVFVCFLGVTARCGCIFHSPVAGFSLRVFEVSWSHTTTLHSR